MVVSFSSNFPQKATVQSFVKSNIALKDMIISGALHTQLIGGDAAVAPCLFLI